MKTRFILAIGLFAAAAAAQDTRWEVRSDQRCIPDFRPAEDVISREGAAFEALDDGGLTLAIDGDADGRGDRLLRLRPADGPEIDRLRELLAEAREFQLFAWGSAPKTIRLGGNGAARPTWLVVRSPNCPLPDGWVEGRDLMMLESLTWIRTPDGPQLTAEDPPEPAELARAVTRYSLTPPTQCPSGGPGALSCGLTLDEGGCYAACSRSDEYACCTPVACGCQASD